MYLHKIFRFEKDNSLQGRQDLSRYFSLFNFSRSIHKTRKDYYKTLDANEYLRLADLAAAHIAALFQVELLKREEVIKHGLRCCRDILVNLGYEEIHSESLLLIGDDVKINYILSPGCQNIELMESRISAVEKVCKLLIRSGKRVDLFFAGKNPRHVQGTEKVKIQNESQMLFNYFMQKLDDWQSSPMEFIRIEKIEVENVSGSTEQNVDEFIKRESKSFKDNSFNLYVVTSSFHLIRVSKEIEKKFKLNKIYQLKNIYLIGSESDLKPSLVTMEKDYIKSMYNEIFSYLMAENDFWI